MESATYPDENQPLKQISLQSFVKKAARLFDNYCLVDGVREPDTAAFHAQRFIRYVLAGRSLNNAGQTVNRLSVNPRMDEMDDEGQVPAFEITRDYDSIIGIDRQIPYTTTLAVFPVPPFSDTLKKKNYIEVAVTVRGQETMISLHNIPNLALGKVAQRHVVRCHFPALVDDTRPPAIAPEDLRDFYNKVLCPAMVVANTAHSSHIPTDYESAVELYRDDQGKIHCGTIDVPFYCLNKLATTILDRAELDSRFVGMFFSHELRGSKSQAPHEIDDEQGRHDALQHLLKWVDLENMNTASWKVDIGIEIRLAGSTVHWCVDNIADIFTLALPNAFVHDRKRLVKKINTPDGHGIQVDRDAQIGEVGGFCLAPGTAGRNDQICYLQAYTTDKTLHYQLHEGIWRERHARNLLPGRLAKLIKDMNCMSSVYLKASGNSNATVQEGCARLEVRISFEEATNCLSDVPSTILKSLITIPTKVFWRFKLYRLLALSMVLKDFEAAPPAARIWSSSLTLGAVCVWMLNALNYRPGDYEAHRELANLTCWNRATIPGYDPDMEVEDPEMDGVHPVHYENGVWFLADIWMGDAVYRMPGFDHKADVDLLARLYGYHHFGEMKSAFNISAARIGAGPPNPAHTHNRNARVTTDIAEVQDIPEDDLTYFNDGVLSHIIVAASLRPSGADMGPALVNADDLNPALDLDVNLRLNHIWRQFAFDVFSEVPNPKHGTKDAYAKLTADQRSEITPAVFKKRNFTPYFTCLHIRMVSAGDWRGIQFARFFPPPKHSPPPGQKNFHACSYFRNWIDLMNRVSLADSIVIRDRLYGQFKTLIWVPFAGADRMWNSRSPTVKGFQPLGGITKTDPAPWLAINQAKSTKLSGFVLHQEVEEDSSNEDEDEDRMQDE